MAVQSNGRATRVAPSLLDPAGWVYVVQAEKMGLVKIGMAREEPARRLRSLQGSSPDRLIVLAAYNPRPHGGIIEEAALHLRFALHRAHGEWFRPAPDLVDWAWHDSPTPSAVRKRCQEAVDAVWKRRC